MSVFTPVMERLLKRIKNKPDCTATTAVKTPATNDLETPDIQQPMKRNSTATSGGGGGVSPVVEFNPRLITRKLCGRKNRQDNELYRSNSFKFERFDRTDSALDLAQLTKQVNKRKCYISLYTCIYIVFTINNPPVHYHRMALFIPLSYQCVQVIRHAVALLSSTSLILQLFTYTLIKLYLFLQYLFNFFHLLLYFHN